MYRLVSRQKQIPNGFLFYQPQTGWKAPRFASFDTIVTSLVSHRRANPFITKKFNLSTDPRVVAEEVDEFNAKVCVRMGWNDYVANMVAAGGQPGVPFPQLPPPKTSLLEGLGRVAAGGKVILEWLTSGEEAVPQDVADGRAAVCITCPLNTKGDWTTFFTTPLANKIREAIEQRKAWNLKTPYDEALAVCSACSCPLPLKIHMPWDRIRSRISQEAFDALAPNCWIRREQPSA
jgi:hypothetical protein